MNIKNVRMEILLDVDGEPAYEAPRIYGKPRAFRPVGVKVDISDYDGDLDASASVEGYPQKKDGTDYANLISLAYRAYEIDREDAPAYVLAAVEEAKRVYAKACGEVTA